MGWTHHWQRETELPAPAFTQAVEDCSRILGNVNIPLAGPDGNGTPIFRPDVLAFNGAQPRSCERFEIHQVEFDRHGRRIVRSFCKTERLPYDLCVQLALIVFKHHLGDALQVGSDGSDEDWQTARNKCQEVASYAMDFQLSPK